MKMGLVQQLQQTMGNCESDSMAEDTYVPVLGKLGPVLDLKITNCIWQKDYQGLFDYQSRQIIKQTYNLKSNCLMLQGSDRKTVKQLGQGGLTQQVMRRAVFEIVRKTNYYTILPIYIDSEQYTLQKYLWLIVKSVPSHRYSIRERDILKFGKQKVKVRQIVLHDSNPSQINENSLIKANKKIYEDLRLRENGQIHNMAGKEQIVQEVQSIATENEQTCRICLEPGQYENPLICPCKCSGSVRYIHLKCLRTWLGKLLNVSKSKYSITIKWTPLACEMCKTHYKYRIYLDNKKYYTVQIPKPARPYIVLEVMKKNAEYSKIFHFVSLSQTSRASIGRRKDIDIKISDDISVSRHHANLIYDFENRRFLLEDNKSKFGTLVLVKKNLIVNPHQRNIAFQIGGQIFIFQTQRGPGAIPDYRDETQYLNFVEKGEKNQSEEESEQNNNEQFEDEQQDEEGNIPTNVNLNSVPPQINNVNNSQQPQPSVVVVQQQPNLSHQQSNSTQVPSLVRSAIAQVRPNFVQSSPAILEPHRQEIQIIDM